MVLTPTSSNSSFARLGLPVAGFVHDRSPRGAFPILFPRPESPGGLLGCVKRSLGHPGYVRFPSFLSSDGGVARVGEAPFSPGLWSPPL